MILWLHQKLLSLLSPNSGHLFERVSEEREREREKVKDELVFSILQEKKLNTLFKVLSFAGHYHTLFSALVEKRKRA